MRSATRREWAAAGASGGGRAVSEESGIGLGLNCGFEFSAEYSMQGSAILVTGAARRIGAAIARRLHAAGSSVVLHCHRSRAEADAVAGELNAARAGSASIVQGDLLDLGSLARIVE